MTKPNNVRKTKEEYFSQVLDNPEIENLLLLTYLYYTNIVERLSACRALQCKLLLSANQKHNYLCNIIMKRRGERKRKGVVEIPTTSSLNHSLSNEGTKTKERDKAGF